MSIVINTSGTGLTELLNNSATNTFTIARPVDATLGVMMIAVIAVRMSAVNSVVTLPSGWNIMYDDFSTYVSNRVQTLVCYKIASGSESSNYTWSWTGGTGTINAHIFCVTGVDETTPLDTSVLFNGVTTGTSPVCPSVTTVTNGAVILAMAGQRSGANLTAVDSNYPTGMTGVFARRTGTSTTSTTFALAHETIPVAGSTGTRTWTNLYTASGLGTQYTLALRPSASTSTITDIDGDEIVVDSQSNVPYTGTNLLNISDILVKSTNTSQTSVWSLANKTSTGGTINTASRNNLPYTDVNHSITAYIRDGLIELSGLGITFNPPAGFVTLAVSDINANKTVGESGLAGLGTIPSYSQVKLPTTIEGHTPDYEMVGTDWTGRLSFSDWFPPTVNITTSEYRPGDTGVWESLPLTLIGNPPDTSDSEDLGAIYDIFYSIESFNTLIQSIH